VNFESIHKRDGVERHHRLLAVAHRFAGKKSRRAVAANIRNDHSVARGSQQGRNIDKTVDIIRPAMVKNDGGTIGGTRFCIANIQQAGIDLLQRAERRIRSRLDRRHGCSSCVARQRVRGTDHAELRGGQRHGRGTQKSAPRLVERFVKCN